MTRGEVWWVERPQLGRRPHLVLTRTEAIAVVHSVIAVPITRTIRDIPTEVRLGPEDGLPTDCVLSFDNTTLIPKGLFVERICKLDTVRMTDVCEALALATGCA